MKIKVAALLLIALLAASGCNTANNQSSAPATSQSESTPVSSQPEEPAEPEEVEEPAEEAEVGEQADPLDGLTLNEYEDLEISAVVLNRMAILPGSAVPVTVTVKNNGEQTISYVQGSGSFETPQALITRFEGLQPVLPRDRVGGIMTMDYVTKELKPGESLEFTVTVMAVEPHAQFDQYTYDLDEDEQTYIADLEPDGLLEKYPDLTAAQPGSYTGSISFIYSIVEEEDDIPLMGEPTGYAQAEIQIGVSD